VAKVGTSKAGGTISQQAAVHQWLAGDAQGNKQKQTTRHYGGFVSCFVSIPLHILHQHNYQAA
jgi:hypothetical protein